MHPAFDEQVGLEGLKERDVDVSRIGLLRVHREENESDDEGDKNLQQELAAGGEAEVALAADLGVVVYEPDGAEGD